jgi:hypothetical protein
MKRLTWLILLAVVVAAVFAFDACRPGGGLSTNQTAPIADDDIAPTDDDTSGVDDDDNDDTASGDDDTSPSDDDSSPIDDDVSPGDAGLAGHIECDGCTGTVAGLAVRVLLYTTWEPTNPLAVSGITKFTVPSTGFPFAYAWDFTAAGVAPGSYYVFAYLDVSGTGAVNAAVDPIRAPFVSTPVVAGQTTTLNLVLVAPGA